MKATGPLDENDKRRLVLNLVKHLRCVVCQNPFHPHDFTLVDRQPDGWILDVECRHCGELAHVLVLMKPAPEAEPVVDLLPEEIESARDWPTISGDDVLDIRDFLREFDGDFETLFS